MNSDSSEIDDLDSPDKDHGESPANESRQDTGIEFVGDVRSGQPFVAQIADMGAPEEPVVAEQVAPEAVAASVVMPRPSYTPVPYELNSISAVGGSVGSVVLGFWSILCSLITPFSAINALLSLLLGAYGLTSNKKRMAVIGIALGVIGLALSLIETNEIISNYFAEEAAS